MPMHSTPALLGGLAPAQFMQRHWQRRPLLVRQAFDPAQPPMPVLDRRQQFALAAEDDVESRLVMRQAGQWQVRHGPFALNRRSLPPLRQREWTLLVQGVDLHLPAAHELLNHFRFVPAARLDDAMVSWASDGGGVGPHIDSYDVFLLQLSGRRRWRVGRCRDPELLPNLPLKILRRFTPQHEWLLEPGDMLYLPPLWAHDGVAEGECMTCSIGFRAPKADELAGELLARLAETEPASAAALYGDAGAAATDQPGRVPAQLQQFAAQAVARRMAQPLALQRALGEWLTEPKPRVWFAAADKAPARLPAVALARATRMLYDSHFVFINGESFRAAGLDVRLMQQMADQRRLGRAEVDRLSAGARSVLRDWIAQGWVVRQT